MFEACAERSRVFEGTIRRSIILLDFTEIFRLISEKQGNSSVWKLILNETREEKIKFETVCENSETKKLKDEN